MQFFPLTDDKKVVKVFQNASAASKFYFMSSFFLIVNEPIGEEKCEGEEIVGKIWKKECERERA